jgi:hypothetical protein
MATRTEINLDRPGPLELPLCARLESISLCELWPCRISKPSRVSQMLVDLCDELVRRRHEIRRGRLGERPPGRKNPIPDGLEFRLDQVSVPNR